MVKRLLKLFVLNTCWASGSVAMAASSTSFTSGPIPIANRLIPWPCAVFAEAAVASWWKEKPSVMTMPIRATPARASLNASVYNMSRARFVSVMPAMYGMASTAFSRLVSSR